MRIAPLPAFFEAPYARPLSSYCATRLLSHPLIEHGGDSAGAVCHDAVDAAPQKIADVIRLDAGRLIPPRVTEEGRDKHVDGAAVAVHLAHDCFPGDQLRIDGLERRPCFGRGSAVETTAASASARGDWSAGAGGRGLEVHRTESHPVATSKVRSGASRRGQEGA